MNSLYVLLDLYADILIFETIANGTVFLILLSSCLFLAYWNMAYVDFFFPVTMLKTFESSENFYIGNHVVCKVW